MKIEIKCGALVISISQLLEQLTADELREVAQTIGCERDVIEAVVDQLVDGWTENSSHGYSDVLHKQRVRILEHVSDVRLKVVRELMREIAVARHNEKRHSDWAWKMYHAWPSNDLRRCPEIGAFDPQCPTEEEVRAAANGGKS